MNQLMDTPGFSLAVHVPWNQKVLYKFIVDNKWTTIDTAPTEPDPQGNINNVYQAPARPEDIDTTPPKKNTVTTPVIAPGPPVPPANHTGDVALGKVPTLPPISANSKPPLTLVPVNDAGGTGKQPPAEPSNPSDTPSTHARPVTISRIPVNDTSRPGALPPGKVENEEHKPEGVKPHNGNITGLTPAAHEIPPIQTTHNPPSSTSPSNLGGTIPGKGRGRDSLKMRRENLIQKIRHFFEHWKEKHHKKTSRG